MFGELSEADVAQLPGRVMRVALTDALRAAGQRRRPGEEARRGGEGRSMPASAAGTRLPPRQSTLMRRR